ncbi:extracellular calcium-sensing receptor-like [Bufo gargarizans]|uniref:extracellular calcium-sensing receptor-like n=1 Tax=Bufo gargarizans TaxID=30331 RepID=UPI001CF4E00E|nr:extracellular calcium-sensing receptor-like [Bufo gargarizans]
MFTIEEVNSDPYLLSNITLGYQMYDTCNIPHYELQGALHFLTDASTTFTNNQCHSRSSFAAIIGSTVSTNSIILAHFLGTFKYPQVSHLSSLSLLGNRKIFPSFFRAVASDKLQSIGLAQLLLHFGWTWIGLVASDSDYGLQGIYPIKEELVKAGACVAFTEYIRLGLPDRNAPRVVETIKESTAVVVLVFAYELNYYIQKVRVTLTMGNEIYFDENGDPPDVYGIVNWQMNPDGTVVQVKIGSFSTSDKALILNSSLIVWPTGEQQVPRSVCSKSCHLGFRKSAIQGQPSCCFECVPCLQGEISNQTDSFNCYKCPWDQWPNQEKSRCLPKPFEFLSYEEALGASLAACSLISSIVPLLILRLFVKNRKTPIVKASNYSLSCLLLVSLCLCFLCSLGFIGYPEHKKCLLRQASFGLVFSLSVGCILAKTIMVVFAFMATRPGSSLRKWTTFRVSYSIIFIFCLLQFILCVTWLSISPPFAQYNSNIRPELIVVDCNEGSPIAFWTMLGYLFLLATISFIVAFLARRLPDSFNEAQFITFSMLAFLSVWVSYIPASLSAQGKYTVAMEIFAILASSWALVLCMFFPKCFFILFRPDINSKENIMRKN